MLDYGFQRLLLLALLSHATAAESELELVLPQEVGPENIPLLLGWRGRLRRGHRSPHSGKASSDPLYVHLEASGRDLYMRLQQSLQFLAPGFVVDEKGPLGDVIVEQTTFNQSCYYTGRVLNHNDSFASLSTCGGLTGYIQMGDLQMQIQPANNSQESFSGREHYIRRRRSSVPSPGAPAQSARPHCQVVSAKKKAMGVDSAKDWRGRRNAIRPDSEYTVETLVVADSDMVQYHGAEAAQRFILTVMNMVYNMFQHQSLGLRVNIQVTKLVLLRQRPAKLSIGHHGERSLESFCHWQNEEYGGTNYLGNNQVPGGKDDAPPVDAAVFMTR